MIAFLEGKVIFQGEKFLILEAGGVGYKVFVSQEVFKKIAKNEGQIKLWTHLQLREEGMELFGFLNYSELEFFEALIRISGIGPRLALNVLNLSSLDKLKQAIAAADVSYLTKVSGIGRKTAEKIVLELKDKLGYKEGIGFEFGAEEVDVLEALKELGYSPAEAREALKAIPSEVKGLQNRFKQALKILAKK